MIKILSIKDYELLSDSEKSRSVFVDENSGLHPKDLKNVHLYNEYYACDLDTGLRFCWVPKSMIGPMDIPTEEYIDYAINGWNGLSKTPILADRVYFGKWVDTIYLRKNIFIPKYLQYCLKTASFQNLLREYHKNAKTFYLVSKDVKSCEINSNNYNEILSDATLNINHAHVLAMMLQGIICEI